MLNRTLSLALIVGVGIALPSAMAATPQGQLVAAVPHGQVIVLQKVEAPVTGTVAITHDGGKTSLVFSKDFSTNPKAPALQVVLVKSTTPLKTLTPPHYPLSDGGYTQVAPLKSAQGAQTYTLPAGVDIKAYGSVLIWCKVANATMAWAPLN